MDWPRKVRVFLQFDQRHGRITCYTHVAHTLDTLRSTCNSAHHPSQQRRKTLRFSFELSIPKLHIRGPFLSDIGGTRRHDTPSSVGGRAGTCYLLRYNSSSGRTCAHGTCHRLHIACSSVRTRGTPHLRKRTHGQSPLPTTNQVGW